MKTDRRVTRGILVVIAAALSLVISESTAVADPPEGFVALFNGNERDEALIGRTVLETRIWHHVALIRNGKHVTVYLNGNPQPEIDGELKPRFEETSDEIFLGGRSDRMYGLEGRLDEVALYDRAVSAEEVSTHFAVAGAMTVPQISEVVPNPDTPPLSTEESMKVTYVRHGFELQLVAAESLVIDPVAIDWGPDGKLWVVESAGLCGSSSSSSA